MRKKRTKKTKASNKKINMSIFWNLSLIILALSFFIGLGYFVFKSDIFIVKKGDIESNLELGRSTENYFLNKSLFEIDIEQASEKIRKNFPDCRQVNIEKRFPSKINIFIVKRSPYAQIKSKLFFPIDRDLVVLSDGSREPLKNIVTISLNGFGQQLKKGEHLSDSRLKQALEIIDALKKFDIFNDFSIGIINVANVQSAHFLINKNQQPFSSEDEESGIKVIIGQGNFYEKIKVLKGVIDEKLNDKLDLVKYIDLRHEKVYVGFQR
ncbi:MAG: FtsQ-type POTRA domain-containing protein [Candidatus Omnitrophica bacterium]|nr:FtsQ-type POTRA domain-containing protein [Candidatus Omnitrophota bacterium]